MATKNAESDFAFAKAAGLRFDLVMVIKTPLLVSMALSIVLFLCSCNKPELLMAEREQAEAEIRRLQNETKILDDKFLALGVNAASAHITLERNISDLTRQNVLIEQALAGLTKKCAAGEEMVQTLRPRLESYKARFAR